MIYCLDPDDNRVELFSAPHMATDPFLPGRPIDGFLTGPYGMGHAVLHVRDVEPLVPFYRDLLEFNVSDYGLYPYGMYFFHVNGRHHSFAMVGTGRRGLHHFMVEYKNLDDVGQGYDLAQMHDDMVAYTLGRHTNDYMTSFYAKTPSDFFIESGWGGRVIDMETWQPHETDVGPSFWGHERVHLPEPDRAVMRELRLKAAAEGRRTPKLVDCPWLYDQLTR
jgi:2,3-dihydroxybiphenyl 1,2-dioxygenase